MSNKKKILLLSDDLRMSSGVGTMSKEFVIGTLHHYDWVQLGGAIKHPEEGKVVEDSVALFSIQFKNVDKLEWEFDAEQVELQRYKPVNSDWLFQSDTIKFIYTLDMVRLFKKQKKDYRH